MDAVMTFLGREIRSDGPKRKVLAAEGSGIANALANVGMKATPIPIIPATQEQRLAASKTWTRYQQVAERTNSTAIKIAGIAECAATIVSCDRDVWLVRHLAPHLGLSAEMSTDDIIRRAGLLLAAIHADPT